MLIGVIGLGLVLVLANNHGQSQHVVRAYEYNGLENSMDTVQAFAYEYKPLTVLDIQVPKEHLSLIVGEKYPIEVNGIIMEDKYIDIGNHPDLMCHSSNEELAKINDGYIQISDKAITGDYVTITCTYENMSKDIYILIKQSLEDTVMIDEEGNKIITNYMAIDALVNKERSLPCDYVPKDLVEPDIPFSFDGEDEKRYMRKEAAEALEAMFKQAKENGLLLAAVSGYRSYNRQKYLHNYKINQDGNNVTKRISAVPGHSEHQTGLAMDITCGSVDLKLREIFGDEPEGIWVKENAHTFGFIIRYPKEKEDITGYSYEPWHLRYLGEKLAKQVHDSGLTYEEFLKKK